MALDDLVAALNGADDDPVPTPAPPPEDHPFPPVPSPDPGPQPASFMPWLVDVDPARPFGANQGDIPAGNGTKSGKPNLLASQCEAQFEADGADGRIDQIELWQLGPKVTADAIMHTPGDEWVSRVSDPAGSGCMVYRHRVSKAAVRYDPDKRGADSVRAEVGGTGDHRYMPWGTEEFAVAAVFLLDYWATDAIASAGEWHVVFQWHDAPGGLTHNPPAAVYLRAGARPRFNCVLRRYRDGLSPPQEGNELAESGSVVANPGVWHWFVVRYVSDAGHGFAGDTPGRFALYHAEGNGQLDEVFDYTGRWGSPNPSSEGWKPGFWKTGLYCNTKFGGRDEREVFTRGFRQYVAKPGMTPASVLADFKAARS